MRLRRGREDPESSDEEENILLEADESEEYETMTDSDSDSSYVPPTKKKRRHKKRIEYSDEESDEDSDDETDPRKVRKTIATLFPSKYMNKRMSDDEQETKISSRRSSKKNAKKSSNKNVNRKKRYVSESESEYSEDDDEYYDDEEMERDFNIIFSALTGGGEEKGVDQNDKDAIEDELDDDCNSDDEKTFMKENYEMVNLPSPAKPLSTQVVKRVKKNKHNKSESSEDAEPVDAESEYKELLELKKHLSQKLAKKPKSKALLNALDECRDSIRKLVKQTRMKNAKKYYKMINSETKQTSEIDYFKKQLSNKEQLRVMKELNEINEHSTIKKPYRLTLLDSSIPPKFKAIVMQKVNTLRMMEPGDPEYFKLKTWVDGFMRIPFSTYKNLNVSIGDGIDACSNFMENAKKTLDDCVYGLDDAKMQIMQVIGQWITNPDALGTAIAIKGPPGTGKTSLVKEGISKILGREFAFIALGGTGDASFLEGHGYTYEGSLWGRIVQILMESKCMNPVIYFDELDKVSDTPRGEEIIGILTHLTDTSQNNQYHDKYFSEIDFDLSKCLFIFSYNDESKVNPILRDRMYRIMTKGYEAKEKLVIARDFLLPKIREQVAFKSDELIIPDETLTEIIGNEIITQGEEGVRNLKRCLEIIHTKLNLFRLMKPEKNIFAKNLDMEITFPVTVTNDHIKKLVDCKDEPNQSFLAMYV
jgi:ATP-dependent Lon protease